MSKRDTDGTYVIWCAMRYRCNNANGKSYRRYGGRGIKVCERWDVYENFLSDMGPRPPGLQIDRIDNDGNYAPENCRWVTPAQNSRNHSRNVWVTDDDGERLIISDWAKKHGIAIKTAMRRISHGWFNGNRTIPVRQHGICPYMPRKSRTVKGPPRPMSPPPIRRGLQNRVAMPGKSVYRGVHWSSYHGKWRAEAKSAGQRLTGTPRASEEDAARDYDEFAVRVFGPGARKNFL